MFVEKGLITGGQPLISKGLVPFLSEVSTSIKVIIAINGSMLEIILDKPKINMKQMESKVREGCIVLEGEKFSVAVLAGGKSTRMGQDKAVLPWDNSDILNSLLVKLLPLSNDVIVVSNTARNLIKPVKQASDIFLLKGPLSGIHAGLVYAEHQIVFVTACDTPFLKAETILKIVEAVGNADAAVVVHKGRIEPLIACYKKSCIKVIEGLVTNGKYSVMSLLDNINWIAINYLDELDDDDFMNINTYSDYEKAKLVFERIKQSSSNVSEKGER